MVRSATKCKNHESLLHSRLLCILQLPSQIRYTTSIAVIQQSLLTCGVKNESVSSVAPFNKLNRMGREREGLQQECVCSQGRLE